MGLIVHHLHMSQSERIPWLCEELGIPYELRTYDRAPLLAPPEYKALHPQGSAPVIQDDGDLTLAESGACVEYIAHRHGGGRLFLPPSHRAYPDFLYWWHWSNGTFMPTSVRAMAARAAGATGFAAQLAEERFARALRSLDERVKGNEWLAGEEFTVADVMVVFTLTTWRYWFKYSLAEYEGILGYLKRIGEREAYRRAMEKADPGMELVLGPEPPALDRSKDLQK